VLQGFLSRPRLFNTQACLERLEGQARANLERSVGRLTGSSDEISVAAS